nr:c-type cytochrome [uncultured Flavobacterium sp.]
MRKKIALVVMTTILISCGKTEEKKQESLYPEKVISAEEKQLALGKEVFNGKGMCYSCHLPEKKVIGPSIKEIAQIYRDRNGDMKAFLLEKAEPIVDPSQYATMKTNFNITKNIPEEELEAVIAYMMSF